MSPDNPVEVLRWLVEAGADEAIGDTPVNRFQSPPPKPAPSSPAPAAPSRPAASRSPSMAESLGAAQGLAAEAKSLEDLKAALENFEGCGLKHTAHSTVFADGNPAADLMLIGEAPGRDEDRQGLPFVGRSGQLLDLMMAAIGRSREADTAQSAIYIANILPWRPPGNRNPSLEEIALCLPFLKRHIEIAQPKVILALGGTSAKHLLETPTGIMKLRGKWADVKTDAGTFACMPTFHPAYLLRQPGQKKYAWADLLAVEERLSGL